MSEKASVNYKIKVKRGEVEIEVIGLIPQTTKAWFDELEKKYLGK